MQRKTKNIIEDTVKLVVDSDEGIRNSVTPSPPTIRRVPHAIRDSNARFYTPRIVSIGPLHRGDEKLQEFERQKADCVRNLLLHSCRDSSLLQQRFDRCLREVSGSIEEIKACYAESETNPYSDVELAKMMVIDACFILHFLREGTQLIGNRLIFHYICFDLLLVENQIPFFVLQNVFQRINSDLNTTLDDLMQTFLPIYYIFKGEPTIKGLDTNTTRHDHILDLVHKLYRPVCDPPKMGFFDFGFHTATELDRSGVNFQPNNDPNWAMAIKARLLRLSWFPWYCYKPLFKMPVLTLVDSTELLLRNLIVYEGFSSVSNYILSYVIAMDELIDTPEDVRTLKESKVLVNHLGSDEMAATMINNIAKDITVPDFFYEKEFKELDDYYNSYWPSKTAELKRKYFKSPWTMIALLAAIALFVLTLLQTFYTIKPAK